MIPKRENEKHLAYFLDKWAKADTDHGTWREYCMWLKDRDEPIDWLYVMDQYGMYCQAQQPLHGIKRLLKVNAPKIHGYQIDHIETLGNLQLTLKLKYEAEKDRLDNTFKRHLIEVSPFKVGDFIYNILGIIKIEEITPVVNGFPEVYYRYGGKPYKRIKGVLSTTKAAWKNLTHSDTRVVKKIENPVFDKQN